MKKLSKNYAISLFEIAEKNNIENIIFNELKIISKIINSHPQYINILCSCIIPQNEKIRIIDTAFKNKINIYLLNFLKVLIDNNHINTLKDCIKEYEKIYNNKNNILVVIAYSPIPMSDEQITRLKIILQSKIQKKIKLINKLDTSIISGIKISFDDNIINLSLNRYFESLKSDLESNNHISLTR